MRCPSAGAPAPAPALSDAGVGAAHRRRLRDVFRSAGWPCHDVIEIELLAAGLLQRRHDTQGRETLRVSDAGIACLAQTLQAHRARRDAHEALVERVSREMTRCGRLAWRSLSIRARVADGWAMAKPDVFSIRHTTTESWLEPIVHEVKVQRSDLLADLRRPAKRAAYLQLAGACWYVLRAGIAEPEEIPPECGVMVATDTTLAVLRPAPRRAHPMRFDQWMALARATPVPGWQHDDAQQWLGDPRPEDPAG